MIFLRESRKCVYWQFCALSYPSSCCCFSFASL